MNAQAFLLAPLVVVVVLFVSGWAKVGDVTGTRLAFVAMKVPTPLARPAVARALPFAELALGCGLLVSWGWVLMLVGAVVTALFLVYVVLVARVLRSGDSVECHCFGTLGDDRITTSTLVRNLLLLLLAAITTGFGAAGSGLLPAAQDLEGDAWWWPVMTALVVLVAVLIVRQTGSTEDDAVPDEELEEYLRQPIPVGYLEDVDGRRWQLRNLAVNKPQLLVFMSVGCGACDVVADELAQFAERMAVVEVASVFSMPLADVPERMYRGSTPWFDPGDEVSDLFADGRPAAVLFGADGMLAGGPVVGAKAIEEFVDDIVAELAASPLPPVAEADPDHDGHDHDGHDHDGHDHDGPEPVADPSSEVHG